MVYCEYFICSRCRYLPFVRIREEKTMSVGGILVVGVFLVSYYFAAARRNGKDHRGGGEY